MQVVLGSSPIHEGGSGALRPFADGADWGSVPGQPASFGWGHGVLAGALGAIGPASAVAGEQPALRFNFPHRGLNPWRGWAGGWMLGRF